MEENEKQVPVIEVKAPPVKAINTCACCGFIGEVAQLKCGYSFPNIKHAGGQTVTMCLDCLHRVENAVRSYLDDHKLPRSGFRRDD